VASSCKLSRWKRASDFFFHFEASPAPASIWTVFPLKLTFLALLAGRSNGPAVFSGASATLLTHWEEVEGPVGRTGASGVGGMAAGDGLALGGFWPGTFLLLYAENSHRLEQSSYTWYEGKSQIILTSALAS
jgi:hypothetical protein